MPLYSYIAKNLKGEPESGTLEAENERELARILRKEGCILVSARPEEKNKKKKNLLAAIPFLDKVSLVDKIMFTRNLQVMVAAGVPLPKSLKILSEQSKKKKFKEVILKIRSMVIKGESFSSALNKYPNIFSELFVSMIMVGEETGTLENVLKVLSEHMEKENEIRARIKGAIIYPAVIVFAMTVIGILMLIIVVPKLAQVFAELEISLPFTTRAIIAIGEFLVKFWYILFLAGLFFLFLMKTALKTKTGKLLLDGIVLKIPIIAPIIKKSNSAHTVRTLSSLIAAGVPIVRSLEILSKTLSNIYYQRAIAEGAEKVKKGAKLAQVIGQYKNIYPPLVIQMIEVGEETGETSTILEKLADFFEEEVAQATKNLSAVIEPFLMLIIGAAVGFFAVSMIQPMYGMLKTL